MIGSLTPLLSLGSGSGSPLHWCGVQSSASVEAGPQGIDRCSSPAKWQLPKLAFTVTSEAATNLPFRIDLAIQLLFSSNRHALTSWLYHTHFGLMHAPVHRAHVYPAYMHAHTFPCPVDYWANLLLLFYVYLFCLYSSSLQLRGELSWCFIADVSTSKQTVATEAKSLFKRSLWVWQRRQGPRRQCGGQVNKNT